MRFTNNGSTYTMFIAYCQRGAVSVLLYILLLQGCQSQLYAGEEEDSRVATTSVAAQEQDTGGGSRAMSTASPAAASRRYSVPDRALLSYFSPTMHVPGAGSQRILSMPSPTTTVYLPNSAATPQQAFYLLRRCMQQRVREKTLGSSVEYSNGVYKERIVPQLSSKKRYP